MRVLITGGTGFIGSHVTRAVLDAGHEVRLFVRTPEKVETVLGERADQISDVVQGDMVTPEAVGRALEGCDAAIHTAAAVGIAQGDSTVVLANAAGTRNVIGQAVEIGLDPILYTSSVATMLPSPDAVLTVDSPLAEPMTSYSRSKIDSERFVRHLQNRDAPIVPFYIGGVTGPDQPGLDTFAKGIKGQIEQGMVVCPGGTGIIDVRDLAHLLAKALEPGRGPRRYMAGGRFFEWQPWTDLLSETIGRRVRQVKAPGGFMVGIGRMLDAVQRVKDFDYPLTREAATFMVVGKPSDDTATLRDLGVEYRPTIDTLRDTLAWLLDNGHLTQDQVPGFNRGDTNVDHS